MVEKYKLLLDKTNQFILVCDLDTLEILYMNQTAHDFAYHHDQNYFGHKCYWYMMNNHQQCAHCPLLKENPDGLNTIDNGKQVFQVKNHFMEWEGRRAFAQYSLDVTGLYLAQDKYQKEIDRMMNSIAEAQGIFYLNLTQDKCMSYHGVSSFVEELKGEDTVDSLITKTSFYIKDEKQRQEYLQMMCRQHLMDCYQRGQLELHFEALFLIDHGDLKWCRSTARMMVEPSSGDVEVILYGLDISKEKALKDKQLRLEEKLKLDPLTQVLTKTAFEKRCHDYLSQDHQDFALIFLDIDQFKDVNDHLGHLMGDRIIKDIAERLKDYCGYQHWVSRFGGDEFCLLLDNVSEESLKHHLDELLSLNRCVYRDDHHSLLVTISMGAVYCTKDDDFQKLLKKADRALYDAKHQGKNCYVIYQ